MDQEAQQNLDKINALQKQFLSVIEDYKKYYVYYNKNPEVEEFYTNFENAKSQLASIVKKLNDLSVKITQDTSVLNTSISNINKQIQTEKSLNDDLNNVVSGLKATNNSSKALIDDSKDQYNDNYIKLWEMILGIFLLGFILAYRFESREFIIRCTQYIKSKATGNPTV